MSYETAYILLNASVMPAWLLLFFAPKWNVTHRLVHSMIYPIGLALFYVGLLCAALFFGKGAENVSMSDLDGVLALFSHPHGILIGWAHFLIFDLFVGAWIARDRARKGISHWLVLPCLFFTLMFGPLGLLLYVIVRAVKGHGFSLKET